MKIGVITIHHSPNYGASLQSFALYLYLVTKGYSCEIIDLARPTHDDFIYSKKYAPLIVPKKASFVKKTSRKIKPLIKGLFVKKKPSYSKELSLRTQKFENFNAQIQLSKRFHCIDDLYNHPPSYDLYLTGSDQVWNPGNGGISVEPFFLTFVNNGGKKIAYAPSFGITSLPEHVKEKYKAWLSGYGYLSVREEEGKKLMLELISKEVEVVLDPTFLLDISYWKSISIKPGTKEKYIFCFILNKNEALLSYAQKIKKELGYKLVVISQNLSDAESQQYEFIIDAGPEEFIGWIENAEMVFTDSFHGTVFSVILAKNFFSYISPGNKRGSRITNLLKVFALSEHLLNEGLDQKGDELQKYEVNREELMCKISIEQKKSRDFLIKAIEN